MSNTTSKPKPFLSMPLDTPLPEGSVLEGEEIVEIRKYEFTDDLFPQYNGSRLYVVVKSFKETPRNFANRTSSIHEFGVFGAKSTRSLIYSLKNEVNLRGYITDGKSYRFMPSA